MKLILAIVAALALAPPTYAQDEAEVELAKSVLQKLQPLSFAKMREYCGYIGFNEKGEWTATDPVPGDLASCSAPLPRNIAVMASYHTHGDFDEGYYNEVPSDIDMESDQAFRMDGYVATPGGRMWRIDSRRMVATMVCDVGCLPVAPGFYKGSSGEIDDEYTYEELLRKLGE